MTDITTKAIAAACIAVGAVAGGYIVGYKKGQPDEEPDEAYDRGYEDGKDLRPSRVEEGAKKVIEKSSEALGRGSRFLGRLRRGFKDETPTEDTEAVEEAAPEEPETPEAAEQHETDT